ncbi:MAG: hypothetical protein OXD42_13700, partial [Rhodospirillaceae bacterium]|nr:hypothetical protein [Rhodospirillaceae bacterium]
RVKAKVLTETPLRVLPRHPLVAGVPHALDDLYSGPYRSTREFAHGVLPMEVSRRAGSLEIAMH